MSSRMLQWRESKAQKAVMGIVPLDELTLFSCNEEDGKRLDIAAVTDASRTPLDLLCSTQSSSTNAE